MAVTWTREIQPFLSLFRCADSRVWGRGAGGGEEEVVFSLVVRAKGGVHFLF